MNIRIPKWVQMVGLPLVLLLAWFVAIKVSEVIFIFVSAMIIALMLNPVVMKLEKLKIPRYLGVLIVFLAFIALIVLALVIIIPPTIEQLQGLIDSLPFYVTEVGDQMSRWKSSLEGLNLPIDISEQGDKLVEQLEEYVADIGSKAVSISINIVSVLAQILLVFVISIYMLLDAKRIGRFVRRFFPQDKKDEAGEMINLSQKAVIHWLGAQILLSFLVGISTSIGIWFLGVLGVWTEGSEYAVFFGVWAGVTEVIPYIGPILGATPPVMTAMFVSPWAALAVVILFIVIQQLEGHVLVPNVMGSIVGVHPLVVIFAVLAGAQLHGIAGMLLALPLVALIKTLVMFFKPRVTFEKDSKMELSAAEDSADA